MIAETAIIHPGVILGENVIIEDFCVIGVPPKGHEKENFKTIIGDHSIIRSHTVIYAGNKIGHHFQTGNKANIRELNTIGEHVSIGTLSVIEHHVDIANNVRIHSQAFIPEYSKLEENCWIGPNVVLTNSKFPNKKDSKEKLEGPTLKKNSRIGANSTLLPGVIVGEDAFVGAGSVVTKDVQTSTLVAGNPARFLRTI